MAIATSNRLLPILASSVLLILVFVATKSCSPDEEAAVVLDSVPEAPAPDADTPADTIKTLTANVAAMTTEVEALRRDNAALRRENQGLMTSRTQIEENVATRLKRELLAREKTQANRDRIDAGVLSSLTARVDALAESLSKPQTLAPAHDIPVGLGLVATLVTAGWVTTLGYNDSYLVLVVLVIGGSFVLASLNGYVLAPRMNRPAWLVLLAPLILVAGGAALFVSTTGALYAVGLGLVVVVLSGLAGSGP